jgi:hypothetical protein
VPVESETDILELIVESGNVIIFFVESGIAISFPCVKLNASESKTEGLAEEFILEIKLKQAPI